MTSASDSFIRCIRVVSISTIKKGARSNRCNLSAPSCRGARATRRECLPVLSQDTSVSGFREIYSVAIAGIFILQPSPFSSFSLSLSSLSTPDGLAKRPGFNRPLSCFATIEFRNELAREQRRSRRVSPGKIALADGFRVRSPRNRLTGSLSFGPEDKYHRECSALELARWSWRVHYSRLMARFTIEKSRRHRLNEPLRVALQK